MTSRERLLIALHGGQPDRVPMPLRMQKFMRKHSDRVCLMGGIDAVNEVYLSDADSIREMVRDRLAIYKPDGGYIMDGSNSIVYETPPEHVRALAQAGREFGVY